MSVVALITLVLRIIDGVMGRMDEASRNAVRAHLRDSQWLKVENDVERKAVDAFDHAHAGGVPASGADPEQRDKRFRD